MSKVEIKDVRAIKTLEFDLPEDKGGVLVFKGKNAAGKTTAIDCLQALMSGAGRLSPRDHAARGRVAGFGASISVTSQTRRSGELEVGSLVGKFDLFALVDPGMKSPEANDRARIKALLALTGAKADVKLFRGLATEFDDVVPKQVTELTDLVEMSAKVAAAFHAEACRQEQLAETAATRVRSLEESLKDVDFATPHDLVELKIKLTDAIKHKTALESQATSYAEGMKNYAELQTKLEEAQKAYTGPSAAELAKALEDRTNTLTFCTEQVAKLERQLAMAKEALAMAKSELRIYHDRLVAAEQHETQVAAMTKALNGFVSVPPVPEGALSEAEALVESASHALGQGIKINDAKRDAETRDKHRAEMNQHRKKVEEYRNAAKKVDDILAEQLPAGPLRVDGGRLVLDSARGPSAPFNDESDGVRWDTAIAYGVEALQRLGKQQGAIPLSQDAWQHLDYEHRVAIAKKCEECKVWIITAEASTRAEDEPDLHTEVFSSTKA